MKKMNGIERIIVIIVSSWSENVCEKESGVASFIDDNLISDTRHDIIELPAQYKRIMHFHFRIYHIKRESRRK